MMTLQVSIVGTEPLDPCIHNRHVPFHPVISGSEEAMIKVLSLMSFFLIRHLIVSRIIRLNCQSINLDIGGGWSCSCGVG